MCGKRPESLVVEDGEVRLCFVCIGRHCPVQGLSDNTTPLLQEYPSCGPILFVQLRRARSSILLVPWATRRKGCGCEHSHSLPSISYRGTDIVFLFTTAVAEYIRIASMQAFLLESQTHTVSTLHYLMMPVGGILASRHWPLLSAAPEPVSGVTMATGDTHHHHHNNG